MVHSLRIERVIQKQKETTTVIAVTNGLLVPENHMPWNKNNPMTFAEVKFV